MSNKLFIFGPSSSVLIRQRVGMLSSIGMKSYWYTQSDDEVEGVKTYHRLSNLRVIGTFIELLHLLFLLCWIRPTYVHVFFAKNRWLNLALAMHPRVLVTVMGSDISPKTVRLGSLDFMLVRLLLRQSKIITSKSLFMDQMLNNFQVEENKVHRITWGVDIEKFRIGIKSDQLRQKLNIPIHKRVFFSLRGCKPLYQHEMVITAFSRFLYIHPDSVLLVSTMGADLDYLKQLRYQVKQLRIDSSVVFLPEISNDEMPYYYSLADAVVSVPISDGMPQSIYESMACGCFHILGDLPQYHEVVRPRESGLYVGLDNDEQLTDAFCWVIDNKKTIDFFRQKVRESVLHFIDYRKQQDALASLYQTLVDNPRC